jgi:hypothetical protein
MMSNVQTVDNGSEYLVFSNLFAAENELANVLPNPVPAVESIVEASPAERIYKLVRRGTFGLSRQQVIDAFVAAGGMNACGQPVNFQAVIRLCLEITAQSHKAGKAADQIRIWFDPFSGRLELTTANGSRDNLTVWKGCTVRA